VLLVGTASMFDFTACLLFRVSDLRERDSLEVKTTWSQSLIYREISRSIVRRPLNPRIVAEFEFHVLMGTV